MTCNEFSPEKALEVTKEVLQYFHHLPWLAAVHINKPQNLHAHFLLGMTNISDGKKYSQSPNELQKFKSYYNTIARKYNIPLVHGFGVENTMPSPIKTLNPNVVCVDAKDQPVVHFDAITSTIGFNQHPIVTPYSVPIPQQPHHLKSIFDNFRDDYIRFFLLGLGRENW